MGHGRLRYCGQVNTRLPQLLRIAGPLNCSHSFRYWERGIRLIPCDNIDVDGGDFVYTSSVSSTDCRFGRRLLSCAAAVVVVVVGLCATFATAGKCDATG